MTKIHLEYDTKNVEEIQFWLDLFEQIFDWDFDMISNISMQIYSNSFPRISWNAYESK